MPRPPAIPPTITQSSGPMGGERKTHPAYGMLRFSRVNGGCGRLFGSEINHQHYIQMDLVPGEEHWHLARVWHHGRAKCLCSVRMSAAQFAELITSMNVGSGVPVTIDFIDDEVGERPGIEDEDTLHEQIKSDVKREADEAFRDADYLAEQLKKTVEASKLPKSAKSELTKLVDKVTAAVHSSLPFVIDQYQEAAEKVGAKAKAELEAYYTSAINRLGVKALAALNEDGEPNKPTLDV